VAARRDGVLTVDTGERTGVVIVGAGFGGLCMAIRLKQAGIHDFVVLEKADELGGTWRENTYPGCSCDVMSLMYSFSFEPKRDWSRMYARQEEILDYIRHCADKYEIRPHIRFGTEAAAFDFDEAADEWQVRTAAGDTVRAPVVVAALGPLHRPSIPHIAGLERFQGTTFHSATWDHSYDLTGKRIAVIGTGASAIQFVPRIAGQAAQVHVFQRTPPWIIPKLDRRITGFERALFRTVPGVQRAYRDAIYWIHESLFIGLMHPRLIKGFELIARRHLVRQIPDRGLRRELTPDYTIGCKRILVSSDYYPALMRDNVELVTGGIAEFTEDSVVAGDGTSYPVDAAIFGTGFHVTDADQHLNVIGEHGQTIQDAWRGGVEAYLGVAVAGFPNFFLLVGPNSGGGHQSIVFTIEAQVRYILECLRLIRERGVRRLGVQRQAQQDFNRRLQRRLAGSVWNAGGCTSWYLDANGVNRAIWPGTSVSYWRRTRRVDRSHHKLGYDDAEAGMAEEYHGAATLLSRSTKVAVDVHLAGHLEPIDGSYRWFGRIAKNEGVTSLFRAGQRDVTIRIAGARDAAGRLVELDSWGGARVVGTGLPPYLLPEERIAAGAQPPSSSVSAAAGSRSGGPAGHQ
jgi:cation diffusion facilitator CzcD-associated flavoprotein CzcO